MFELITELLTTILGRDTKHNRKSMVSKIINIAKFKTSNSDY